jgi:hypothetical protein
VIPLVAANSVRPIRWLLVAVALALFAQTLWAQRARGPRGQGRATARSEYPTWENDPRFARDVFTFVRVQYDSYGGGFGGGGWRNDYPDCDLNFSYRLQQLTSFKVDPHGKVLRLTDPELFDYPFLYMSNAQNMALSDAEAQALGRYLRHGGFLMVDDFWAPWAWEHIRGQFERILPGIQPRELTLDHRIFHIVYDLAALPQVPSILAWRRGETFEYWHGDPQGDEAPHFWGYFDDAGRLMALCCHNNDIGDGWEREGEESEYFRQYSEKWSYPLGINIVTYVMTH